MTEERITIHRRLPRTLAAEQVVTLRPLQFAVFRLLSTADEGMTCPEIGRRLGKPQTTIAPRLIELEELHLIRRRLDTRKAKRRQALVWELCP